MQNIFLYEFLGWRVIYSIYIWTIEDNSQNINSVNTDSCVCGCLCLCMHVCLLAIGISIMLLKLNLNQNSSCFLIMQSGLFLFCQDFTKTTASNDIKSKRYLFCLPTKKRTTKWCLFFLRDLRNKQRGGIHSDVSLDLFVITVKVNKFASPINSFV